MIFFLKRIIYDTTTSLIATASDFVLLLNYWSINSDVINHLITLFYKVYPLTIRYTFLIIVSTPVTLRKIYDLRMIENVTTSNISISMARARFLKQNQCCLHDKRIQCVSIYSSHRLKQSYKTGSTEKRSSI